MKRRLLSAFLAVMMVLTMAPVAFAADEEAENTADGSASVGASAKTLQQQIDGIKGTGTVTLDQDYTEDITIQQGQNITLDLNGKKLTNVQSDTITVTKGAKLTIEGAGTVDNVTHAKSALVNYGEVVLNNGVTLERSSEKGTLSPYSNGGNSCYTILNDKGATMIINNATVKNSGGYSSAIRNGGDSECNDESHLTIKDGNFSGGLNAVKNDECGILTIDGGTFSNTSQYVIMNWNKATITNGTFSVKDSADAVLFTAAYHANRAVGELIVNNGTFTGNGSQKMVENHYGSSYTGTASITGGTFSSDVSAYVYVAEGYVQNNGTVEQLGETNAVAKIGNTYYKTLAAAVAAAQDGQTVKLLKNVTSANRLEINQSITLDLGDYTFELTGSGNTARAIYINNGANVTIKANEKGGVKAATIALQVNAGGKLTIESGTYTGMYALALFSSDTKPAEAILNNGVFNGYIYTNGTGHDDHITFNGGTYNEQVYLASGDKSTYTISNGTFKNSLEIDAGRLDISGGTFTANIDTSGNANHPVTNNNGSGAYVGTLVVCKPDGSDAAGYIGDAVVNITGGTFENTFANGETIVVADFGKEQENVGDAKVTISDNAKIKGVVKAYASENNTGMNFSISGGYFTTDPSAYVASGYVAGTSDVSGYSYKVVAKTNTGSVEVKPDVADPEVKVDKIPQKDQETVKAAAETVSAPTLGAAAVDEAQKISEDKANELLKDVNVGDGVKKLYVQSSLKVEPTAYNETTKTLALDITPQYRIVASTAATADDIELGDNGNAQVVQDYQPMNITKATVVTMELPADFASGVDKLSIQHTKSNGTVEYYTGTVAEQSGKHLLTFTTNGFSPFVISVPAASIGENVYPTLQAAVENVKNNEIIKLAKDIDEAIVVTVAKSIKFTVNTDNKTFNAAKNIVAGSNTTVKVTGESSPYTYEFTYTKPSSGSSGGSSSGKTTYKVTTSAVNNGGVNASPSSAEKGATITITLSPDKGYKLDKLTVIDGSGKTVSTVKKSDTVYTFTMPASAVKVGVSYVKATETPSKTKFNDVSANDWFASAVDYVTGKGMMNGTADNTFSPKANTTRGMVVTVLYRLENQPSTSAASFTDVASGAYYANAVAWANANGIVSGYGSGKFGPNDKVTREQLAAILYRYAQYKKYDVSGAKSLDGYTDAQSVSSYAVPALQWANAAGIVTGKSGSKLDPKGNATRAEVAAMLMRFCENVK